MQDHRVFIIDKNSEVRQPHDALRTFKTTYSEMEQAIDHHFPVVKKSTSTAPEIHVSPPSSPASKASEATELPRQNSLEGQVFGSEFWKPGLPDITKELEDLLKK